MKTSGDPDKKYGKWFCDKESQEISGTLITDKKDYSLVLILYAKVDFFGESLGMQGSCFEKIQTIYGRVEGGTSITLCYCSWAGETLIGEDLWEVRIKPELSFLGGLLRYPEKTTFHEVTCSYPYLSSWYDTNRIFFGSLYTNKSNDDFRPALTNEDMVDKIDIDGNLSISIVRRYIERTVPLSLKVSSEVIHLVSFESRTPLDLNKFRKLAYRFFQLIQLSTGTMIYMNLVHAVANGNDIDDAHHQYTLEDNQVYLPISYFTLNHKRHSNDTVDYIHQNMMLFYGGQNKKHKLNQAIVSWFMSYDKYSTVYQRFLDTFDWFQNTNARLSEMMFYNRFLNVVQAIESYHLITYPDFDTERLENEWSLVNEILNQIDDSVDREWLNTKISLHVPLRKRLQDLIENHLEFISYEIFKNRKERKSFIQKIKIVRDDLSHGNEVVVNNSDIIEHYEKALISRPLKSQF